MNERGARHAPRSARAARRTCALARSVALVAVVALVGFSSSCGFYAYDSRVAPDAGFDAGIDAGFDAGFDAGCDASFGCAALGCRGIFVTGGGTADAAFGGVAGADAICAARAIGAGLGGTWKAWISDGTSAATDRLTHATGPYQLRDGTVVANDWADLTDGTLAHAIDVTEAGDALSGVAEVWTATTSTGAYAGASCGDWTNATASSPFATVGVSLAASSWTDVYLQFCDRSGLRFYCLEQ